MRWSSALSVRVWLLTEAETKAAGEVVPVHWQDAEAEFFRRFEELKQLQGGRKRQAEIAKPRTKARNQARGEDGS